MTIKRLGFAASSVPNRVLRPHFLTSSFWTIMTLILSLRKTIALHSKKVQTYVVRVVVWASLKHLRRNRVSRRPQVFQELIRSAAETAGTLHIWGFKTSLPLYFNKPLWLSVFSHTCGQLDAIVQSVGFVTPGYHRWKRDFHSDTTTRCCYSHFGDRKTTADEAVNSGMCSAVRAVIDSALENATCNGLHSYAKWAQSLPSSFSPRQLSKVKSLLFPKISKQNIYLMTCMNEWLSCMEKPDPQFCHQHHKCANCVHPAGQRCIRDGLF